MPRKLNSDLSRFVTCLISSDLYEKRRIDIRIGFFFLRFVVFTLPSQIGSDSCFFQMFSIQYFILDPKTFRFFLLSLILGHKIC